MHISALEIEAALRDEDIESLIVAGAPKNEYASEAEEIGSALAMLHEDQKNLDTFVAVIALVWTKSFNRTAEEIQERLPTFKRIAQRLLADG